MRAAQRAVELSPSDPESLMSLAKAQVRFGAYAEAVTSAERARRLHPFAPQYYPYIHGQALYAANRQEEAEEVLADCLLRVPDERNCLRIRIATLARLDRVEEARALVARLIAADPAFSVASEQSYKRFGDFPLMERYVADLRLAGVPEVAGQA
jgi:adenylate cyclase